MPEGTPTRSDSAPATDLRQAVIDHLTAELGDAYDCTRVWSAWDVGTMTRDDFAPLTDRVEDIADAILAVIAAAPTIWVMWSDDGERIRKWDRKPFDGSAPHIATEVEAGRLAEFVSTDSVQLLRKPPITVHFGPCPWTDCVRATAKGRIVMFRGEPHVVMGIEGYATMAEPRLGTSIGLILEPYRGAQ